MAKNSIYDYSTTASNNTDIGGTGILGTNAVSNFDDAFRTIMAQIATDISPRRNSILGALYGLTLSNNAGDATNDIDIAVGMATTDSMTDPRTMVLASALTKRLDAAWAVGTGNGGLDTGSIANTTYHVWLIQRSDTGVVDALFSTSATSPTMPANYDRKRRIGSIIRAAAAIRLFQQNGDTFNLRTPVIDRNSVAAFSSALLTLTVPTGIIVQPILSFNTIIAASGNTATFLGDAAAGQAYALVSAMNASVAYSESNFVPPLFSTNTSSQLYYGFQIVGSATNNSLTTNGWVDARGRY